MALAFGVLPANVSVVPSNFTLAVTNKQLFEFETLVSVAKIPPSTWYSRNSSDGTYGISRDWLVNATSTWTDGFDWRENERKINHYPNFKTNVTDPEGGFFDVHFAALFSQKEDATPILFMHGWPGSFLEFLPLMDLAIEKYTPETLPYHIIAPSLPGYGLTSDPSEDVQITFPMAGRVMNSLMTGLGFESYVAQGGDVGSFVAQQTCSDHAECKAFHLNMLALNATQQGPTNNLTVAELDHLVRVVNFGTTGSAYNLQHETRPSSTGLLLALNPVGLLGWVGEKFIEWADKNNPLSLDTILESAAFWWFTDTLPRSLWPYGSTGAALGASTLVVPFPADKPFGYSEFAYELAFAPRSWVTAAFSNLVFYNSHDKGGHFAALEQTQALFSDVEAFVTKVKASGKL